MKDTLKRMLGITPAPAQAETQKDTPDMVTEANTPSPDATELQASVTALTTELAATNADLVTALAKITALTAQVDQATAFQAEQERIAAVAANAAAKAKTESRISKLASVLGDEKAVIMNTSLASLDDVAFDSVLASLGFKSEAESKSPLFNEVGVDGEVDATKLVEGNRVMDYLTAKYPK